MISINPNKIWLAAPVLKAPPNPAAFARQARASGANALEFRVDALAGPEGMKIADIIRLLKEIRAAEPSLKLIFTPRSIREGGAAKLPDAARREMILRALKHVDAVDVEWRSVGLRRWAIRQEMGKQGKELILSWHDFSSCPTLAELDWLAADVRRKAPGALLKIAARTRTRAQVLRLIRWTQRHGKEQALAAEKPTPRHAKSATRRSAKFAAGPPAKTRAEKRETGVQKIAVLSMGRAGETGRLALAMIGSRLAFAVLEEASAPGQIPLCRFAYTLAALQKHFKDLNFAAVDAYAFLRACKSVLDGR